MVKKIALEALGRVDVPTYKRRQKHPLVLVLDNIRSAHNVGAAFRTADAFAIERIVLVGITPTPPHPDITKSAIGATLSVDYSYVDDISSAIQQLIDEKYAIVGLEQTTESHNLAEYNWPSKCALVVGNEVHGISENVLPLIDHFIEIPQHGTKHSLNVSVATGVALWSALLGRQP